MVFQIENTLIVSKLIANDDMYNLVIRPDIEVDALIEANDFAKAEKLAREKNLDPRMIATIMALAGKKDESFSMFIDYLSKAPEPIREELALQSVNLVANASQKLSNAFLEKLISEGILRKESTRVESRNILTLLQEGNLSSAEQKIEKILDSSVPLNDDIKHVAQALVARFNMEGKTENANAIIQKLRQRFSQDIDIHTQWISSLVAVDPKKALLELDKIRQTNQPENDNKRNHFWDLLKAKALANLGEDERAKKIYESLASSKTGFETAANAALKEYKRKEERITSENKRWEEKLKELKNEVPTNSSPYRFWSILVINIVFIAIILYTIYRRKRK
jgi:hypothetical protein